MKLNRFFNNGSIVSHEDHADRFAAVIPHYRQHQFDLLGSGWVRVCHGMKCRGLEGFHFDKAQSIIADEQGEWLKGRINRSNLPVSQRIWHAIDPGYNPIDWQLDFKSGYRWSEKTWSKNIRRGHKPGADIKVPWELARMQHLPQLALRHNALPDGSEEREKLQGEFRNQLLDFISTNPPHFGVNWACAMDVAIRAANCLIAHELFLTGGARFDDEFSEILSRNIYGHGLHIVGNLEWHDRERGNHYLAEIAGLAFIAASLSSTAETDAWLAFAIQELVAEVEGQFHPDGGHFECSTAYHRLSAEIVYFATALVLGLPRDRQDKLKHHHYGALKTGWGKPKLKPGRLPFYDLPGGTRPNFAESPFPAWYFERMERMAELIMDITKPGGRIPQIGDNDSGRFFKLDPHYERMTVKQAKNRFANLEGYNELPEDADYFMEDHLDGRHLVAAASGLFERADLVSWLASRGGGYAMADYSMMQALSGEAAIPSQRFFPRQQENNEYFSVETEKSFNLAYSGLQTGPVEHTEKTEFPARSGGLLKDIVLRAYCDFGLFLYKSPRLYLAVRCQRQQPACPSAHAHHDQLAIELVIDGEACVTDPGTYIYTPLPRLRNRYRYGKAHFIPQVKENYGNDAAAKLFQLKNRPDASCLHCNERNWLGRLEGVRGKVYRAIQISDAAVSVADHGGDAHLPQQVMLVSPGYGLLERK